MITLTLLEGLTRGAILTAVFLIPPGLIGLRVGWVAYTEPTPRFVLYYRGWSCTPLAMFYGGISTLIMGLFGPVTQMQELQAAIPDLILGVIGLAYICSTIIFLLGFFFWFPPFLLPPWYRRARKAGIPRNDPEALETFKALPKEQQKAAIKQKKQR